MIRRERMMLIDTKTAHDHALAPHTTRTRSRQRLTFLHIAYGREIETCCEIAIYQSHRTRDRCNVSYAAPCRNRGSPVAHAKRARTNPPSLTCCSCFAPAANDGCCPACCVTNLHARTQQPPSRPAKNQVSTLRSLVGRSCSRLRLLE